MFVTIYSKSFDYKRHAVIVLTFEGKVRIFSKGGHICFRISNIYTEKFVCLSIPLSTKLNYTGELSVPALKNNLIMEIPLILTIAIVPIMKFLEFSGL